MKPKGKGWVLLGEAGVDSGQLLVTDPCYIPSFKSNEAPNKNPLQDKITGIKWQFKYPNHPVDKGCVEMPGSYESTLPGTSMTFNEAVKAGRLVEIPDPEPSHEYSYKGCCELTCGDDMGGGLKYELGHMGQGVVFSSGYGDGCYAVWGRKNKDGRIVEVRILMG
jgi:hypothetical protein